MAPPLYRKSYVLPGGFSVEFGLNAGWIDCEWSPGLPRSQDRAKLVPHYRNARNEFVASLGLDVTVIEL